MSINSNTISNAAVDSANALLRALDGKTDPAAMEKKRGLLPTILAPDSERAEVMKFFTQTLGDAYARIAAVERRAVAAQVAAMERAPNLRAVANPTVSVKA